MSPALSGSRGRSGLLFPECYHRAPSAKPRPGKTLSVPALGERSALSEERVLLRERDVLYVFEGLGTFAGLAGEDVPRAALRIRPDNGEVRAGSCVLVPDSGRDHDNVPGTDPQRLAGLAAEGYARLPADDAENLV